MKLSHHVVLTLCFYVFVAAIIGWLNHRRRGWYGESAQHFLHTSRDLSFWVISLAFLAANCSALEVLTMIAVATRYGVAAVHFYWIGAIPALAFLLCVLLPRYQQLGIVRVPEYLERRFGASARVISAASFCLLMSAIAGITLCIGSRLLHLTTGMPYGSGVALLALAAAGFLLAGGLSAVLYSEALQLVILLLVLVPLSAITLRHAGGIAALSAHLTPTGRHAVSGLAWFAPHAPLDRLGILVGLGVMLSFSYWCADFLLIQRLGAAGSREEMLRTPGIAIMAKLALPLLLVVPGLSLAGAQSGQAADSLDLTLPRLLLSRYSGGLAAVSLAALIASLFAGVCGNISAAVAIFAEDLYRPRTTAASAPRDRLFVGRLATMILLLLATGAAYLAFRASSLMEYIQLVLSSLNVPIATVLLMGIFVPWFSRRSGSTGLVAGTTAGLLNWYLSARIGYGSGLAESFYGAMLACLATTLTMVVVTCTGPAVIPLAAGHVKGVRLRTPRSSYVLAAVALVAMLLLYYCFR